MFYSTSKFKGTLCGNVWTHGDSGADVGCCLAGSYMSAPESVPYECTKCPVGQAGSDVVNDDTSCPEICTVGKSSSLGDTSCQDCVAGKYITAASSACEDCDAGMSSLPGKTLKSDCTACNVGLYSSIGSACKNCPKGYEIKGTDVTQCFVCSFSKVRLFFLNVHLLETS